jgi:hypothetical protein
MCWTGIDDYPERFSVHPTVEATCEIGGWFQETYRDIETGYVFAYNHAKVDIGTRLGQSMTAATRATVVVGPRAGRKIYP